MSGLNPYVIRSKGVKKCRRFATGNERGPSGGSFAREAACAEPQMFVMPSRREVNPYAPATLIGPERLFTLNRADAFTTSSVVNRWTDAFRMCREFVQRYVVVRP